VVKGLGTVCTVCLFLDACVLCISAIELSLGGFCLVCIVWCVFVSLGRCWWLKGLGLFVLSVCLWMNVLRVKELPGYAWRVLFGMYCLVCLFVCEPLRCYQDGG
jgi:hypothetical protein